MRLKLFAKKTLPFFVLLFLLVTLSCIHNPEMIKTDTDTGTGSVPYELLGKKYSYIYREIIEKYGSPQTLSGTNNGRWVAYFPKGDFTIISDERTSTINAVLPGRKPQ
jgi:hypothetical protein